MNGRDCNISPEMRQFLGLPRITRSMGTIPSLHTQIRFKHKSDLGESFETVPRDEEKNLRWHVDPHARELENASICSFPQPRR
jgi:hypothetical protein